MANTIHYRKLGVTGGLITGTASDANGPKSFTDWTNLKLVALHPDTHTVKFQQTITADPDQVTNPGEWSYQPVATDVDTRGEFPTFVRGTDPDDNIWEFPIDDPNATRAYDLLIIY